MDKTIMDKITTTTSTSTSTTITPTAPASPPQSKLQLRAKAKLEAVMNGRGHHTSTTNRIGTSRHPSMSDGSPSPSGAGIANMVSHPPRRPSTGGLLKRINSQPAY